MILTRRVIQGEFSSVKHLTVYLRIPVSLTSTVIPLSPGCHVRINGNPTP
jgi:hypothetical protein